MGVEYRLVSNKRKERYDLGRGNWRELFTGAKKIKISDYANSLEEFSLLVEIVLRDKELGKEAIVKLSTKIWNWAKEDEFYFGDDCLGVYEENSQVEIGLNYPITGSVYDN